MTIASCPCGAEKNVGQPTMEWVTAAELLAMYLGVPEAELLDPIFRLLISTGIDIDLLCGSPQPSMPTFEISDLISPAIAATKAAQAYLSYLWPQRCHCTVCPPVSTCGMGGQEFSLSPGDGWFVGGGVDEYWTWIASGHYYAQGVDGVCWGDNSGLEIRWYLPGSTFPVGATQICDGHGNCHYEMFGGYGTTVTVWAGDEPEPPVPHGPKAPDGAEPLAGPPACDGTTICTALDYVYNKVDSISDTLDWIVPFVQSLFLSSGGSGGTYTFNLPGLSSPIIGSLNNALPRALSALAPAQPSQLQVVSVVDLAESGTVDVFGDAVVSIDLTVIPEWQSVRGDVARVQFSKTNSPSSGWVLVCSDTGVMEYYDIRYPDGLTIVLPALADHLLIQLSPATEVTVTTYERVIPE